MSKTPLYIGIFCQDPKNNAKELKNYSKECLKVITEKFEDSPYAYQDLDAFDDIFSYPKDNHHITTAFLGKNPSPKISKIYKNFKYK